MFGRFFDMFVDKTKDVEDIKMDNWLSKEQNYAVYLLTDSKVNRVARFFVQNGLNIYSASDNIGKIGGRFVMDVEPSILLLLDTGKGLFSSAKAQRELIDVIGAGDLTMNKAVIIFYTDSSVKVEALSNMTNVESVKWLKYAGSSEVLRKMLEAGIKTEKSKHQYKDNWNDAVVELPESEDEEHIVFNDNALVTMRNINRAYEDRSDNLAEDEVLPKFEVKV